MLILAERSEVSPCGVDRVKKMELFQGSEILPDEKLKEAE